MPIRQCKSCLKTFEHKGNYDKHMNKKNKCSSILNIFNDTNVKEENIVEPVLDTAIVSTDDVQNTSMCIYCNNSFSDDIKLKRHITNSCKIAKSFNNNKDKIFEFLLKNMFDMKNKIYHLEKENNTIKKNMITTDESPTKPTKIRKNRVNKTNVLANLNNNSNNNSNNNNSNSNNSIVQNNQVINKNTYLLVAHGKENIDDIDSSIIMDALKSGYKSVPTLIKGINCNEKYPQYQNIYDPDKKGKYFMVYDGIQWMLKLKSEVLENTYDRNVDILEDKFEDFYNKLSKSAKASFERFVKDNDNNNSKNKNPQSVGKINNIKESIKIMITNHTDMVKKNKETYKKNLLI